MTDKELLTLAAKAAGIADSKWSRLDDGICFNFTQDEDGQNYSFWNPLTDDGDALRLAVKLRVDVNFFNGFEEVHAASQDAYESSVERYQDDMGAATRRAVVRAAAEIGRALP